MGVSCVPLLTIQNCNILHMYLALVQCDAGTSKQIAGPKWRRMTEHLQPRALVECWCKWGHAFRVRGRLEDVAHTANMLYDEIQRCKHGVSDVEDYEVPHGCAHCRAAAADDPPPRAFAASSALRLQVHQPRDVARFQPANGCDRRGCSRCRGERR